MEEEKDKEIFKPILKRKSTEMLFFSLVAGMSILGGFGTTIVLAKRKDPNFFAKGLIAGKELPESGGALALRALGRGSAYAVGGFSLFCALVWKLSGAHSMVEFRNQLGSILPSVPKQKSEGRTEFTSLRDLVNYLIEEDERNKFKGKNPNEPKF